MFSLNSQWYQRIRKFDYENRTESRAYETITRELLEGNVWKTLSSSRLAIEKKPILSVFQRTKKLKKTTWVLLFAVPHVLK